MKNKSLHNNSYINIFFSEIGEYIFQMLVYLLKPIVQFIYKKYRAYKRKNKQIKTNTLRTVMIFILILLMNVFWI